MIPILSDRDYCEVQTLFTKYAMKRVYRTPLSPHHDFAMDLYRAMEDADERVDAARRDGLPCPLIPTDIHSFDYSDVDGPNPVG